MILQNIRARQWLVRIRPFTIYLAISLSCSAWYFLHNIYPLIFKAGLTVVGFYLCGYIWCIYYIASFIRRMNMQRNKGKHFVLVSITIIAWIIFFQIVQIILLKTSIVYDVGVTVGAPKAGWAQIVGLGTIVDFLLYFWLLRYFIRKSEAYVS